MKMLHNYELQLIQFHLNQLHIDNYVYQGYDDIKEEMGTHIKEIKDILGKYQITVYAYDIQEKLNDRK